MNGRSGKRRRGNGGGGDGRTPGGLASEALTQLALWTAANLAGMVTALLILRRPFFRRIAGQIGVGPGTGRRARKPSPEQSLPMLADAVLGSSKSNLAAVFGPPRSAALFDKMFEGTAGDFQTSDLWYYPLPRQGPLAMAIRFNEGFADRVEFFTAPRRLQIR